LTAFGFREGAAMPDGLDFSFLDVENAHSHGKLNRISH